MRLFIGSSVSLARIHESGKIVPKTIGEMMRKPVFWIILLSIGAIAFCGATDEKVTLFLKWYGYNRGRNHDHCASRRHQRSSDHRGRQ